MGPVVGVEALPEHIRPRREAGEVEAEIPTLAAAERRLIEKALIATEGNQARAAAILQIDRRRLYRKIELYNLRNLTGNVGI